MNNKIQDKLENLISRIERLEEYVGNHCKNDPFVEEELEFIKIAVMQVQSMTEEREKSISDLERIIKNLNG
jgi:hypothetical protein